MRIRAFAFILATTFATSSVVTLPVRDVFAQGMDADTKEAKALFEDGVKLYKAGKYEEARVKFKAAYGLKKRPSIILNLANAEVQTKRPLDAIAHFKEVMAMGDAKPDDKDEAKNGLAEARKQVGTLNIDAPTGSAVTVDGESRTVPPDSLIEVMPGAHTVVLKGEAKKIDIAAGQTIEVKAGAAPVATVVPTATATTPPAPTATTPPAPTVTAEPTATAAPTETATPPPPPPPTTTDKRGFFEGVHIVTYVAAGVTVLGAAGWIGFYAASQTNYANADKYAEALGRPTCGTPESAGKACTSSANKATYRQEGKDAISAGDSQKTLSIISGVVTVVGLGATIGSYIFLRKKPESKPAVAFVPVATPTAMGFSLVGQF